jgi:hypothetical protein
MVCLDCQQQHVPANYSTRDSELLRSYGSVRNCDYLVVLEILGCIIFLAASIVESTSLKLDKITACQESETVLTLATLSHRTLINGM